MIDCQNSPIPKIEMSPAQEDGWRPGVFEKSTAALWPGQSLFSIIKRLRKEE
jgi:hypothetical protein